MERNDYLYGLAIACPLDICDKECPFDEFRILPIKERIKSIRNLSEAQKIDLIKKHKRCIERYDKNYFQKPKP